MCCCGVGRAVRHVTLRTIGYEADRVQRLPIGAMAGRVNDNNRTPEYKVRLFIHLWYGRRSDLEPEPRLNLSKPEPRLNLDHVVLLPSTNSSTKRAIYTPVCGALLPASVPCYRIRQPLSQTVSRLSRYWLGLFSLRALSPALTVEPEGNAAICTRGTAKQSAKR